MTNRRDTIFALSSGMLPSGVAVVRISGPVAFDVCGGMAGLVPEARRAAVRSIRDRNGHVIDEGVVLAFPAPHSFTGEDCVEFQLHGSKAVVAALYACLEQDWGCRLAEAGEFSRRAFENDKLDLVEVEGLADLLAAETEMQRRLAVEESFGARSKLYNSWRERILHARAMLEAELDFADEDDVPGSISSSVIGDIAALSQDIARHLENERGGEIIRDGFKVVIAGAPNVGKSSLINALTNREIAIVTNIAGTTRDIIHADIDIRGYLVRLFDTAGLREAGDEVERIGIARARAKAAEADLVLLLSDTMGEEQLDPSLPVDAPAIKVGTKADLLNGAEVAGFDVIISTIDGTGIEWLKQLIIGAIERQTSGLSQAIPSRMRHVAHLRDTISALQSAESYGIAHIELAAESLRLASDALGRISGRIDTEEILGVIFSSFCIGK